jgi:5-methylthioribose kinase
MDTDTFSITPENVAGYLAARGLAADDRKINVRELGGGVSNIILLVEWPEFPERRWVVKQSLEKLRVEDDWRSDRARIYREADAIQAMAPVLGGSAVPRIVHVDRENFLFIMSAAPAGSVSWKEQLLAGEVDLNIARQTGDLLAQMIAGSRGSPELQKRFEDRTVFDQLRIDPYYRTTARRQPDARGAIVGLMAHSWNIQSSLVHGDFSPKNMLVRDGEIVLIDWEVVHWGDPAFDAGFLLNHLFLKAMHRPEFARDYFAAVRAFWEGLGEGMEGELTRGFEALTLRHLGALMLARIDGKSPVEYIRNEAKKELVRSVARRILREQPQRLGEVVRLVAAAVA